MIAPAPDAATVVAPSRTGLTRRIEQRIRREGPISVAAYMAMALHDPADGYYARRDPIGAAGDFVTAPEISQTFGELIGLWCADLWRRMGQPDPVRLVELGPGRGVLMADLVRAAATVPAFRRALRPHLVEASPVLRAEQERRLTALNPVWSERIDDIPEGPFLLIANEFLDALPIRQLIRGERDWAERLVALDPAGRLVFTQGPESQMAGLLVPLPLRGSPPGTLVEICPAAATLAGWIGDRLSRQPGAALLIDYGYFPSMPGPSLRAIVRHRPADPLVEPGNADLSAHVDFAAFAQAAQASGCDVWGPVAQGDFLRALGVETRLATLSAKAGPDQRRVLAEGVSRLIDPAAMGKLFQVLALTSPGSPTPAGLDRSTTSAGTG